MFRHLITSINYKKLIEQQANKLAFNCDQTTSKKIVVTPKGKVKKIKKTRLS